MGFFDLNIPYYESDRHVADKSSHKSRRLKLVLKTMELGYTGIAYNRNIKGVISESDRCSISPFPLSSLLKLVPSSSALCTAVKFHRDLLNVAVSTPFRQYTRLTVVADTPSQIIALNAGNPILKGYDITAVRPLNQSSFDQACQISEVDIIVVDFTERLPFRLKQPMVKAAIKRGVYFEITYSGLIGNAQIRRLMISNAKILVDWTRGKNLILSSAASSASELRGPQDTANLLSLLGVRMEHAKAALSKNCRSLITKALKKKQFYKEAVKVEELPAHELIPGQLAFDEWLKWDPISSGEGDLLLDDMEKSFSMSTTTTTVKTIEFTSTVNGQRINGLQIKDLAYNAKVVPQPPDISDSSLPFALDNIDILFHNLPEEESGLKPFLSNQSSQPKLLGDCDAFHTKDHGSLPSSERQISSDGSKNLCAAAGLQESKVLLDPLPIKVVCCDQLQAEVSLDPLSKDQICCYQVQEEFLTPSPADDIKYHSPGFDASEIMPINSGPSNIFSKFEETEFSTSDKLIYLNGLEENGGATETPLQDKQSQICGGNVLLVSVQAHITARKAEGIFVSENHASTELWNPNDSSFSALPLEVSSLKNGCDGDIFAQSSGAMDQIYSDSERVPSSVSSDTYLLDTCIEREQHMEMTNDSLTLGDRLPIDGSSYNLKQNLSDTLPENVIGDWKPIDHITKNQNLGKSLSGGRRRKWNSPHQPFLVPFKPFLKPYHFRRKSRKLKPLTTV